MLIRHKPDIAPSEITSQDLFAQRRRFLTGGAALMAAPFLPSGAMASSREKLPGVVKSPWTVDEPLTSYERLTTYGNFYEFGPDKDSPVRHAGRLKTRPWTITIEGEVAKPRTFGMEDILKLAPLEERIYRLRCVEGWSAVVPWVGLPLQALLKLVEPTGNAKFAEFYSLADPAQMPYVKVPFLDWPYMEALRLDEAMHPLTLLAVGLYGEVMPNQNGAPARLVVPWKYGFKGAKSIVKIRLVARQPETVWTKSAPDEYGFYSNVNPDVPHKRWSQSSERRLGEFFKRKTLPFNGYAEQVGQLYTGMDLRKYF